jgi:hypothetical protein
VPSDPVVVEVDTLQSIAVSCRPYGDPSGPVSALACLPSGLNFEVHCQATGAFANNGPDIDITDQVTWVATNAVVARATGLVAFLGPDIRQSFRIAGAGIARLYARQGTRTSLPNTAIGTPGTDPWAVQGVVQTLSGAPTIQPASPNVGVGDQVQLQALATFNPTAACPVPPTRDFSLLVDWASTDESVADVSFFGAVTGVAEGGVTISATYGTMLPVATVPLVVNPQSP